jgi:calcium homeostasis ER protein
VIILIKKIFKSLSSITFLGLQLLNLWESKNNYFDASVVEKLKNPARSWSEYQAALITQHAAVITPITTATKQTYEGYQAQHQAFVQHAMQQIQTLEQQKQQLEQQQQAVAAVAVNPTTPGNNKHPSELK